MNVKRLIAGAAVAAGVLAMSACSNPPTHGYIYSVNYEPAGSIWWPGHYSRSCSGSGRYRSCYSSWSPGWDQYIPAEWQFDLCQHKGTPSKTNACGWRDVDPYTFDHEHLGQYYTVIAGQ